MVVLKVRWIESTIAIDSNLLDIVIIKSGKTTSLDPKFPFDTTIYHGRDDITVSTKGTHFNLDCKVFGTLEDNTGFSIWYGGVIQANAAIGGILGKKLNDMAYEDGYVTNNVYVTLDKGADSKYNWVETHNLIGRGRFFRDAEGTLNIEYKVYAVVPWGKMGFL